MAQQEGVLCEEVLLLSETNEDVCVKVKVHARVMGKVLLHVQLTVDGLNFFCFLFFTTGELKVYHVAKLPRHYFFLVCCCPLLVYFNFCCKLKFATKTHKGCFFKISGNLLFLQHWINLYSFAFLLWHLSLNYAIGKPTWIWISSTYNSSIKTDLGAYTGVGRWRIRLRGHVCVSNCAGVYIARAVCVFACLHVRLRLTGGCDAVCLFLSTERSLNICPDVHV